MNVLCAPRTAIRGRHAFMDLFLPPPRLCRLPATNYDCTVTRCCQRTTLNTESEKIRTNQFAILFVRSACATQRPAFTTWSKCTQRTRLHANETTARR